jgi:ABC-type polysaccharide/polyol phosphate transport system ATPase subunit
MAVIKIRDLKKSFLIPSVRRTTLREHVLGLFRPPDVDRLQVLDGVSLDVEKGEVFGIMGRNGCGKSTLLKILAGIYTADSGEVRLNAPITPILELGVGWNTELNAIDNILLVGSIMGVTLGELKAKTPEILAFGELERFAQLEVKHFSSGMMARLAFAVAFLAVRDVLILDEIYAVGDAAFQKKCTERFMELHGAGHTIVIVSHQPADVADFCNHAVLLEDGRIIDEGTGPEIARSYTTLLAHG